jgi:hypothetical protein
VSEDEGVLSRSLDEAIAADKAEGNFTVNDVVTVETLPEKEEEPESEEEQLELSYDEEDNE